MVSSLKLPSSFSNPQVMDPSSFSSRYFLRIWATGFFGLSSARGGGRESIETSANDFAVLCLPEWWGFWCGRCSSKFCARGLGACWTCGWGMFRGCCGTGLGRSTLNRCAFDWTSVWNCSCGSDVKRALGADGGAGWWWNSSSSSVTGFVSSTKRASVCCTGLCGFLTRTCPGPGRALPGWFWRTTGSGTAPGTLNRGGAGPSNCAKAVARQQNWNKWAS